MGDAGNSMKKPDTLKVLEWSIKTIVTIVIDIVVIKISNLQGDLVVFPLVGVILFFILLAGVHFGFNGLYKLIHWLKTPDRKRLVLEPISSKDDHRPLLFINKEFRAPFIRIDKVYLGYEQRIALSVIPKDDEKIERHPYHQNWQKLKIRSGELPLELPKSKKIIINFIKIDTENNQFYFDLEEVDKIVFDVATHIFQVALTYNVKKEMGQIKRYKVRVLYQGSDRLITDIEHFD
jgi:hypothetical protein